MSNLRNAFLLIIAVVDGFVSEGAGAILCFMLSAVGA